MFKKIISVLIIISFIICFTAAVASAENNIAASIDGENITFSDVKPFINDDSKLMCPIRIIAEAMGAEVKWADRNNLVSVIRGSIKAEFKVGTNKVSINGITKLMKEKTVLSNKHTYVPLQFISEVFDAIVDWNYKSNTLNINSLRTNEEAYFRNSGLAEGNKKIAENLQKYMDAYQKASNFQGSVLVAKEGKILVDKGYGPSDVVQGTKNTSQTRFAIGSVTKQFTAMAIMQLQEKGLLNVEDKLSKYYPGFKRGDEITLHHLLTHSSGIPNFTDMPDYISQVTKITGTEDIIAFLKDKPLDFEPGKKYNYSNSGYVILGQIIEKVSGLSYGKYLKQNIFDPLGMKDTGTCYTDGKKGSQAWGHVGYLEVMRVDDESITRVAHGAGIMYSTVEDLYRWDRALYTEKLVSNATIKKIFTEYVDTKGAGYYGYGWMISKGVLGKEIWHNGHVLGFYSEFRRYVDKDICVIVLTNKDYLNSDTLIGNLEKILSGDKFEMPAAKEVSKVDTKIYKNYTGEYELAPGVTVKITSGDDHLYATVTGQGTYEIYPESDTKFFYKAVEAEITFVKNAEGEVTEIIIHQYGQDYHGKNVKYPQEGKEETAVDQKIFDTYVGEYEVSPGFNINIFRDSDNIYAQVTGQEKIEIFAESETEFFCKTVDVQITFEKNDKGEVTGLIIQQSGMKINARKVK